MMSLVTTCVRFGGGGWMDERSSMSCSKLAISHVFCVQQTYFQLQRIDIHFMITEVRYDDA